MTDLSIAALPPPLREIGLRPLFVMSLEAARPTQVGRSPDADRRVVVVTGGRFEGERLRGTVQSGGSDWQTVRSDGAWTLDVRLVLETDDGALIAMSYRGLRHGPPEVLAALAAGQAVDPASYYFRSNPMFETAAPRYAWLNRLIAVGTGHRFPGGPVYNVFEVT